MTPLQYPFTKADMCLPTTTTIGWAPIVVSCLKTYNCPAFQQRTLERHLCNICNLNDYTKKGPCNIDNINNIDNISTVYEFEFVFVFVFIFFSAFVSFFIFGSVFIIFFVFRTSLTIPSISAIKYLRAGATGKIIDLLTWTAWLATKKIGFPWNEFLHRWCHNYNHTSNLSITVISLAVRFQIVRFPTSQRLDRTLVILFGSFYRLIHYHMKNDWLIHYHMIFCRGFLWRIYILVIDSYYGSSSSLLQPHQYYWQ